MSFPPAQVFGPHTIDQMPGPSSGFSLPLFCCLRWHRFIDNLWTVAGAIGFSGVLVGAYFLFSHNWHMFPAKFGPINNLMLGWMAIRPLTNLPALPPNVAASLMAISADFLARYQGRFWLAW